MLNTSQANAQRKALFAQMARQVGARSGVEISEHASDRRIPLAAEGLGAALQGGFQAGAFYEFVEAAGRPGGASLVLESALEAAQERNEYFALIDACDGFCPETTDSTLLKNLFWARCQQVEEALQAADYLVRDRNFHWLCLDFRGESPAVLEKIPSSRWFRLQRAAKSAGQVFLTFLPVPCAVAANKRFCLEPAFTAAAFDLPRRELLAHLRCVPGGRAGAAPRRAVHPHTRRPAFA